MIYITGECHGNFERFNASIFPEQKEMTKDDYVIICGDFGGVWSKNEESNTETMLLDWLDCKSFTTLFVDGNHENHSLLAELPKEEKFGGVVGRVCETMASNDYNELVHGIYEDIEEKAEKNDTFLKFFSDRLEKTISMRY